MAYTPAPVPEDCPSGLRRWLADELRRIAAELATGGTVQLLPRGQAPLRPREGLLAYANGATWDPGAGAGTYVFEGGTWRKI